MAKATKGFYTHQEIANILGLSPERVRQIEALALAKLSHPKNAKKWQIIRETIEEMENQRAKDESN